MVQILEGQKSMLQQLLGGAVQGTPNALQGLLGQKKEAQKSQLLEKLKGEMENIPDEVILQLHHVDPKAAETAYNMKRDALNRKQKGEAERAKIESDALKKEELSREKDRREAAKPSKFEQELEKGAAKRFNEVQKEIPQIQNDLATIKDLRGQVKKVSGLLGSAKAFIGSEDARTFENTAAPLLNRYIKLFNPAGTLPQKKLEWIKDQFHLKASDYTMTLNGKLNAMERLNQGALMIAQKEAELLQKYNGKLPKEALDELSEISNQFIDQVKGDEKEMSAVEKELRKRGAI